MNESYKNGRFLILIPKFVIPILRIMFGLLFIFSGITKVINIADFELAIKKFALIPDIYAPILSHLIPIAEIVVGILIVFNIYILIAVQSSIFLLIFFTSVITVKVLEGGDLACGCFGALSSSKIDRWTILRNIGFLLWGFLLLYFVLIYNYNKFKKELLKQKLKTFAFISLLIFLIVQNIAFAIRNIELKNRVYRLIEKDILSKGDRVEPFIAYRIEGTYENIAYNQRDKTILFIMKYGCITCKNNVPTWNMIFSQFNSYNVKVLGISVDPIDTTKKMMTDYNIYFDLAYNTTEEFHYNFKIFLTPITVIINSEGIVEEIWKGAIKQKTVLLISNILVNKQGKRR